ncbi:RNA polymerase sigma factor, RpoD/SigA family [Nostoc sp. 'Peltigera membranacea cyanobiont' 210A]|uniref:RNA polymerase sigma factor, RpoD/SigA family n=1 Tax=Nostoc sp. 'Peltigera membranacea cyanobiont' 210A TaxID=2014529 RepID=UPI000B955190|nr:RNA polymerase sigma factor, RpoD/SigA family [Nostoc sp. 'Peltigera membranacea cyanobiont' 210A]OYD91242.1 RNA polymerase sigma factor, RpoD/SigA family [Nostoc sp. 'Peltigera membranacea cyanobiont' 210A]
MSNLTSLPDTKAINTSKASQFTTDTVRAYLQEIGRIPLLTQEQEVFFAQQVQQMMKILAESEKLTVELNRTPTLSEWSNQMQLSEQELLQKLNQGKKAKQKMMASNLRLVVSIAKQYQRRNLELMDLIQEGTLGLERGIEKFNPALGYRFSTYVYWWIRQGITRAIAQQGRAIRLPIHINEKLNKIKRVQRELSQKLGRVPTTTEIAHALSLEPSQIREYLTLARQTISLDIRVGSEKDVKLEDLIEDYRYSENGYTTEQSLNQELEELLSSLSRQQQEILNLHFGLTDGNELSLEQIGQRMGISRERVRQIEKQALHILYRQLKNNK